MGKTVCVTGASGYIATWLVKLLLERGYAVKATVRNLISVSTDFAIYCHLYSPLRNFSGFLLLKEGYHYHLDSFHLPLSGDSSKVAHLKALEGANERLQLYEANLLEEGCFDSVVDGCEGVFHTASPVSLSSSNPQKELIDPAVKGTLNVLNSCTKVSTIKRVVITSSIASVMYNYDSLKHDFIVDETWFSDPVFCEEKKEWYALSKTLAETATWKFTEENGLDVVTLHPGYTIGPPLQPTLNLSCVGLLNLIKGGKQLLPNGVYRYVDVRDVALAHILAFENASARGRYCLVGRVAYSFEAIDILKQIFPSLNLPPTEKENRPGKLPYQVSRERAESLGISFRPLEESLKDSVESFKERNLITF